MLSKRFNACTYVYLHDDTGRIAKVGAVAPGLGVALQHLTDRAAECFGAEQCQPRHVAQALWACAKLGLAPAHLLRAVLHTGALMQPSWFKAQEVSMAVWAVGKLSLPDADGAASGFVARLLPSALARPREFDPQGLANMISGVASVGVPAGSRAVAKLVSSLRGRLQELNPQEVANSLHGLAKLGARLDDCQGIASEVQVAIRERLPQYTPQQVNIAKSQLVVQCIR